AAFLATPRHPLFQNEWVDKSFRNHLAIAPDYAIGWAIRGRSASSGRIVGHTGFTGTSLHFSPRTGAHVVLLTNRVHPTRENMHIADLRREVLNAIFGRIDEV
ncbi:MAG TPA: beta-lactamase family protein, partial [Clostridiales bacterium]|nr:beta-lactamase family protein [Clostridiales bacterium]